MTNLLQLNCQIAEYVNHFSYDWAFLAKILYHVLRERQQIAHRFWKINKVSVWSNSHTMAHCGLEIQNVTLHRQIEEAWKHDNNRLLHPWVSMTVLHELYAIYLKGVCKRNQNLGLYGHLNRCALKKITLYKLDSVLIFLSFWYKTL